MDKKGKALSLDKDKKVAFKKNKPVAKSKEEKSNLKEQLESKTIILAASATNLGSVEVEREKVEGAVVIERRDGALTVDNMNPNIVALVYAVRGPLAMRADAIELELAEVGTYNYYLELYSEMTHPNVRDRPKHERTLRQCPTYKFGFAKFGRIHSQYPKECRTERNEVLEFIGHYY